jgi:GNAT superfamily N-acetyltransferase
MQEADIDRVRSIEDAAGEAFRALGMTLVADDPAPAAAVLHSYVAGERAWVWTPDKPGAAAGGYLIVDVVDGCAHIAQVSVHPECAGRRIGASLIDTAAAWASAHNLAALTLTTFRDVPWNAPYYWRLGFRPIPADRFGAGLSEIHSDEAGAGLDTWPRVVMRRELPQRPTLVGVSRDRSDRSAPGPADRPSGHSVPPGLRPGSATA